MDSIKEKAIAFCRVSSDEQLKNHSLSKQQEAVERVAEKHNLEIVKIWSGSFSSKCGKNIYRKDLLEALDYCSKNKQIKYAIVDEPDRFMRSVNEAGWYIIEFQKRGVDILFSDEMYNNKNSTAKLLLNMALGAGEASNEERARKTKNGHEKAIRDGRYPFATKLGYMKGPEPAVAIIDPVIGPILKEQLIRIAKGLVTPTIALQDYNRAIKLAGINKAPLKMDKWRRICTDPYYCGVVEMHKTVDAYNPNGLHEKLITKLMYDRIVEVFNGRPKNQKGPNSAGNPLYPFNQMIVHADCPHCKSKYNKLVGVTVKGGSGKKYPRYRCRGCNKYILTRDEARDSIGQIVASMELTENGKRVFQDALTEVFENEVGDLEEQEKKLNSQRAQATSDADSLMDQYLAEKPGLIKDEIRRRYERAIGRIKAYDKQLEELEMIHTAELNSFIKYALDYVNNLVHNVLNLPPYKMQLCKQLLFPDGFYVDGNKNVYTTKISPIYRLKPTKKDSSESSDSLMVHLSERSCNYIEG